jgi:hypothetical protein
MAEGAGDIGRKGLRVTGLFVFMVGAGLALESPAPWWGAAMALAGLGLWLSSFVAKDKPGVIAERVREEP